MMRQENACYHDCFARPLLLAGEDDYEQVEKGRAKGEVEGEEAGKME